MSVPSVALALKAASKILGSPRWSVVRPFAVPASMAGLVTAGSCVSVGPPLFCSGPSCGSWPMIDPPAGVWVSSLSPGASISEKRASKLAPE